MSTMGMRERMQAMQEMQQGGMLNPGAALARPKGTTGKRLSPEEKRRQAKDREREARRKLREEKDRRQGADPDASASS